MKHRTKNILISLDQFLFVLITLGGASPDETISAAAYRLEMNGHWVGKILRPLIDWIASPWEKGHCYKSFVSEMVKAQLPKEYR